MNDAHEAELLAGIRALITPHLQRQSEPADDTPLVSGGLIDSMKLIDVILDLEERFGIRIPVSEVQPDDFDTIRSIARTVCRFRRA